MSLAQWISEWGYYAVFFGAAFEGEGVIVLGGYAAYEGYLSLPLVIGLSFLAACTMDQTWFHVGRRVGTSIIERRPSWNKRATRVRAIMARHAIALGLGFRFLFGMRTVTPLAMGTAGVPPVRFLLLDLIGAAAWATTWSLAGYFFGTTTEAFLAEAARWEVAVAVLVVLALITVIRFVWKRG